MVGEGVLLERLNHPDVQRVLVVEGRAMINAVSNGYPKQILDVKDIVKLANT